MLLAIAPSDAPAADAAFEAALGFCAIAGKRAGGAPDVATPASGPHSRRNVTQNAIE